MTAIDDLVECVRAAMAASCARGPAWCNRELDRMEAAERIRRDALLHQAGPLGLTNDGDIVRLIEGRRG